MKVLKLKAMAKINLGLDVLRRREDGYHDLRMVMQTVRLYDRVSLTVTRAPGIRIRTNRSYLPENEKNLAWKAAALLLEERPREQGIYIDLEKHIPVAAGLAGGSSDAAAVMVGMNRLFDLGFSREELMERGLKIGADVPYCILRGTAKAEGVGEILTPLPPAPDCYVLLAKPAARISTAAVFGSLKADQIREHPDIDGQIEAIRRGDLREMAALMGNVLEEVTVPLCPEIREIREKMMECGALNAMMSGSGPTVFGLFEEKEKAGNAYYRLKNSGGKRDLFLTAFYNTGRK